MMRYPTFALVGISCFAAAAQAFVPTAHLLRSRRAGSVVSSSVRRIFDTYNFPAPVRNVRRFNSGGNGAEVGRQWQCVAGTETDWAKKLLSDHPSNNITPYISNLVGRDLHLKKAHPLNIIKSKIEAVRFNASIMVSPTICTANKIVFLFLSSSIFTETGPPVFQITRPGFRVQGLSRSDRDNHAMLRRPPHPAG